MKKKGQKNLDFEKIRRLIIAAICSDDFLMKKLVLKGGNALALVHGIGKRASLDLDFSMAEDFQDLGEAKRKLFDSLRDRFDSEGFVVFDEDMQAKPKTPIDSIWGGYEVTFKLLEKEEYKRLKKDPEDLSRQALTIGADTQKRSFRVEISKHEYVIGKTEAEIDDFTCYVYTLPMIAAEKLRALCQQMEDYELRGYSTPRARDFFDIHATIMDGGVNFSTQEFIEIVRNMFQAKKVPLTFLGRIGETRDFHSQDWASVKESILDTGRGFDYYFDFILREVEKLKPLWVK